MHYAVISVCLLARELQAVSDPYSEAPCLWLSASVCAVCPRDKLSIAAVCRTAVARACSVASHIAYRLVYLSVRPSKEAAFLKKILAAEFYKIILL